MRFLAILLSIALTTPAGAQIKALSSQTLTEPTAPWAGSRNYLQKVFRAADYRVTLEGPVRLREYVVNGKLELSLKA